MHIKQFKSLYDVKFDDLKDFNILIGKNGSGKSNILEALELFFVDLNLSQQTSKQFGEYIFFDRDASKSIVFDITISLSQTERPKVFPPEISQILHMPDDFDPEVHIVREISGNMWKNVEVSIGEWTIIKDNGITQTLPRWISKEDTNSSDSKENKKKESQSQSIPPNILTQILLNLTNVLRPKFRYIRTTRESGEKGSPGGPRPFLLDNDTRNVLTNISQSSARHDTRLWRKTVETYRNFSGNTIEPKGGNQIFVSIGEISLPLNLLGGGDQEILILVNHLLGTEEHVIGIEEPETHLHSEYIRKMLIMLKDNSHRNQNQMFITTHSSIFVDRVDLDSSTVWSVKLKEEKTMVQMVNVTDSKDIKSVLTDLGVRMSDVLFAERILFVEGSTEKVIIPLIAEKMNIDLVGNGVEIIPMNGKGNANRHISMWKQLAANTQLPMFFIFDGDAKKEVEDARKKGYLADDEFCLLSVDDIEDLYPSEVLLEVLSQSQWLGATLKEEDIKPPRKEKLEELLRKKAQRRVWWKKALGKEVVSKMTKEQINQTMRDIVISLEKLIKK
jgi:predicted ATP-dependent endonuclease of OLD family